MTSKRISKYRLRKSNGREVVTPDGRDFYLGRHGSQESPRSASA